MKIHTLLILDDDLAHVGYVKSLLSTEKNIETIGVSTCTDEGLQSAIRLKPDIVLMDVRPVDGFGSEIAGEIKKQLPATLLIIYSEFSLPDYFRRALNSGVHGIIHKKVSAETLLTGIRSVMNGRYPFVLSSDLNLYMDSLQNKESGEADNFHLLTPREKEIFLLIAEGWTNHHIAKHLGISAKTVDSHRTNMMQKLEIHSIRDLIKLAIRKNMIRP